MSAPPEANKSKAAASMDVDSSSSELEVKVKQLHGSTFTVRVARSALVRTLKQAISAAQPNVPADGQRLIYKGRVLIDDKAIATYNIANGDALHLIVRDPNVTPAASAVDAAAAAVDRPPLPQSAPESLLYGNGGGGGGGGGANPNNVFMSSMQFADGNAVPDLNSIVNGVLQSMGVHTGAQPPAAAGSAAAAGGGGSGSAAANRGNGDPVQVDVAVMNGDGQFVPSAGAAAGGTNGAGMLLPPMDSNDIRTLLNSVASDFEQKSNLTPAERGVSAAPLTNSVANLPLLLAQANALMARATAATTSLSTTLTNEQKLSGDERKAAQASAHETGVLLRRLGNALTMLGQRVTSLQMGAAPGQALLSQAPQAPIVQSMQVNAAPVMISFGPPQLISTGGGAPGAAAAGGAGGAGNAANNGGGGGAQFPFPFPFPNFQMPPQQNAAGSAAAGTPSASSSASSPSSGAANPNARAAFPPNPAANPAIAQMLQQFGAMMAGQQNPNQQPPSQPNQPNQPAANQQNQPPPAAAGGANVPPNPFAAMMAQLGPMMQQIGPAIAPMIQQFAGAAQQQQQQQNGGGGGAAANPFAAMMQQLMGAAGAFGGANPTANPTPNPTPNAPPAVPPVPAFIPEPVAESAPARNSAAPVSTPAAVTTPTSASSSSAAASATPAAAATGAPTTARSAAHAAALERARAFATRQASVRNPNAPPARLDQPINPLPTATPVSPPAPSAPVTVVTPAGAMAPMNQMMQQMMRQLSSASQAGASAAAAAPAGINNLMSSLLPMVSQMLSGSGSNASLADLMGGGGGDGSSAMKDDDDDAGGADENVLDRLINKIIHSMSMTDIMSIVGGNWAPIQRLEGSIRNLLLAIMRKEDTPAGRRALSRLIARSLSDNVLEASLVSQVRNQFVADASKHDLVAISAPYLNAQAAKFVDMVLSKDRPAPSAANPAPFADAFKSWALLMLGGWVDLLSESFTSGVKGVDELFKLAFQAKVSGVGAQAGFGSELGFMLPMLGGIISNVVTAAHASYRSQRLSAVDEKTGVEQWMSLIDDPNEAKQWAAIIRADEAAQRSGVMRPQPPFSRAYGSGRPGPAFHSGSNTGSASPSAAAAAAAAEAEATAASALSAAAAAPATTAHASSSSAAAATAAAKRKLDSSNGAAADKKLHTESGASASTSAAAGGSTAAERERIAEKMATTLRMLLSASIESATKSDSKLDSKQSAALTALDAAPSAAAAPTAASAVSSEQFHAAYRALIFRDLRARLASDPDYDTAQFPNATRFIAQHPNFPPVQPPTPAAAAAAVAAAAAATANATATAAAPASSPPSRSVRMDELD